MVYLGNLLRSTSFPLQVSSTSIHVNAEQIAKTTTKKCKKASNKGNTAAKRRHKLKGEASQARFLPVKLFTEALMLLQSPRKRDA